MSTLDARPNRCRGCSTSLDVSGDAIPTTGVRPVWTLDCIAGEALPDPPGREGEQVPGLLDPPASPKLRDAAGHRDPAA